MPPEITPPIESPIDSSPRTGESFGASIDSHGMQPQFATTPDTLESETAHLRAALDRAIAAGDTKSAARARRALAALLDDDAS